MRYACRIFVENIKRRDKLEDLYINEIILKWIMHRLSCVDWINLAHNR
jgi:hypothetical protein